MSCKPKTIPKELNLPDNVRAGICKCGNCGCTVTANAECHCHATNMWNFDPYDGWWLSTIIPREVWK